jgi:hypothetical protein
VIIDWVPSKELDAALEEERERQGVLPSPVKSRSARGQSEDDSKTGVGSEAWRKDRMDEFIEAQRDQLLPRVMFANGQTCESCLLAGVNKHVAADPAGRTTDRSGDSPAFVVDPG